MRALISVSDKRGVVEFCRGLSSLGVEILSTGGTASLLTQHGVPVLHIEQVTGFPEMLDGRVKTLQPAIHAGILAVRDKPEHIRQIRERGIEPIDLVAVNLYPFEEVTSRPSTTLEEAIENVDIGGPTLIRAAAKNHKHVLVVVDPDDYEGVLRLLRDPGGISEAARFDLAVKAFSHTAQYDAMVAEYLGKRAGRSVTDFPDTLCLRFKKSSALRYGENPHQKAAFYVDSYPAQCSLARAEQLAGKELSFNNINDTNAAVRAVLEFDRPTTVAVKHANPCGVGSADTIEKAFEKAYDADPISIFGGIVAVNRTVNEATARLMVPIFLEVVIAPDYEPLALELLKGKKDLRLLKMDMRAPSGGDRDYEMRRVMGGILIQERDQDPGTSTWKAVTKRRPDDGLLRELLFGWRVVKNVKSNAIVISKDEQTIGIGAGQMSRIGAAQIAIKQAGDKAKGAVMASDAFFPFPDVVNEAAAAGIRAIVQPGGSVRDRESIEAADLAGISMVFTGVRHFTH